MNYDKIILPAIFILALLAVGAAGAADNVSDDIVCIDEDSIELSDDSITKEVELSGEKQAGIYGVKNNEVNVYVRDSDGNNVTGGSVTFADVFGKNYTSDVKDGVASAMYFAADTGEYNITCSYLGSGGYGNATAVIPLIIPVADTACSNIVATRYGDTVYFSGNVKSDYTPYHSYGDFDDFEEVSEGNVTVYVNGERLGVCGVDINGNFAYIWKTAGDLIGQTVNFTGRFTNDLGHFNPSNFSRQFTFEAPKATEITYDAETGYNGILINGTVIDEDGKGVIGGTVTVNDIYTIPVDGNGTYTFRISNRTSKKANYTLGVIDFGSKADITVNEALMNGIKHTALIDEIIGLCKEGSPYIKFGNGNGKTIIVNVGTHGGELASQAAGFKLIDLLANYGGDINGTIYVFPVIFPEATANNVRIFNYTNLNTVADVNGSISNNLVKFAQSVNASGLGDFHCTRHSDSDVGITCAMGSLSPTSESSLIAHYIANQTGYDILIYDVAGVPYAGAIEDYCNILGIPAVTCEALTNHKVIEHGSPELSFSMMKAFLNYFGYSIDDMLNLPLAGANISLKFESPYNYNSSNITVELPETAQIVAGPASYVINYGGKYSMALKDSNGNPIASGQVTFTLNGIEIASAATGDDGICEIKISSKVLKAAKSGKRDLVITLNDTDYMAAAKTVQITVKKEKTKLSAKNKKFKSSSKIKKYCVVLKDSKKRAIKNAKVTLKVKGKTYKAKTNSKGKATFRITELAKKGKYKASVAYKGDSCYSKAKQKVKITVR